ncbi:MAG: LptE family protein, partial [Candidatus Omnitrophota bacterium]|nr:LptE family protein [Candidatus Omnitrophota bacterium]
LLVGKSHGEVKDFGEKSKMKTVRLAIFLAVLSFAIVGCGYTTRSGIVSFRTIYVEPFKNDINYTSETNEANRIKSYFPLLEVKITNEVVNRYLFDGSLKVVKEENADVILKGELLDYVRDVLRYDDNNNPLEYRVSLAVKLILRDAKDNKQLWEETRFVGDTTYFVSGSTSKSEATAINDAVVDLARRIVERTVEVW